MSPALAKDALPPASQRTRHEQATATNELSKILVNNVECSNCHALYQVNLVREPHNG